MDLKEYLENTAEQVDKHIYRYFGETCGDLGSASSTCSLREENGCGRSCCFSLPMRYGKGVQST